jgi:hypothetical protein
MTTGTAKLSTTLRLHTLLSITHLRPRLPHTTRQHPSTTRRTSRRPPSTRWGNLPPSTSLHQLPCPRIQLSSTQYSLTLTHKLSHQRATTPSRRPALTTLQTVQARPSTLYLRAIFSTCRYRFHRAKAMSTSRGTALYLSMIRPGGRRPLLRCNIWVRHTLRLNIRAPSKRKTTTLATKSTQWAPAMASSLCTSRTDIPLNHASKWVYYGEFS